MRAASEDFQNRTMKAINAMRLAAHSIIRGGDIETTIDGISIGSYQSTITFSRKDGVIVMGVAPREELAAGNEPATISMTNATLQGSRLFEVPIEDLPNEYARLFTRMTESCVVKWLMHDDEEVCLLHAVPEGERAMAADALDDIGRGIDALTGKASIYMRHPGLGTEPAFDPLSEDGRVAGVPPEDDEDPERRAAGARIRLARTWAWALPDAIVIRPLDEDGASFGVWSHALTVAPPEDRSEALKRSIRAYMRLAMLPPQERP